MTYIWSRLNNYSFKFNRWFLNVLLLYYVRKKNEPKILSLSYIIIFILYISISFDFNSFYELI